MVTIAQVYISKKERYPDFFVTGKLLFLSYIVFFKTALNSKFASKRTCATATMYKNNSRDSSKIKGFSSFQLHLCLIVIHSHSATIPILIVIHHLKNGEIHQNISSVVNRICLRTKCN